MHDRRVRPRITDDCTLQDFRHYLTEEGQRKPKRAIDKVVRSMRGRVNEVLRNGGGHTTTELCYRFFCAAIERLAFENDPPCVHFNVKLFR